MRPRVHGGTVGTPGPPSRWRARTLPGTVERMKIGEVAVCGACLKRTYTKAELAAKRCSCGGRIVAMPRGEVEKRRSERR
jgi:DNA-directed RNA polymerase subunit RPC12/RpoP